MTDDIIPINEAARRLEVTPALIRRWIAQGRVQPVTETRTVTTGIRVSDLPALARRERRRGWPAHKEVARTSGTGVENP